MKIPLEDLLKRATPLPWPKDWNLPESEAGTTCQESNANSELKRHSVNALPKTIEVLKRLEWSGKGDFCHTCPCCCEAQKYGHREDCVLKIALDEAQNVEVPE